MAGIHASASVDGVALAAATAKTVLQITAAANHRVLLRGFRLSLDGVAGDGVPVRWGLYRQTTAGTMTAVTEVLLDDDVSETLQTTCFHTATAEPTTAADPIKQGRVHPQTGYGEDLPFERPIHIGGGDRLALVCTAAAIVNVNASFDFEE